MRGADLPQAEKYTKAHIRKRRWYRVVTCLAAIVVFCTTYALILPAITLENDQLAAVTEPDEPTQIPTLAPTEAPTVPAEEPTVPPDTQETEAPPDVTEQPTQPPETQPETAVFSGEAVDVTNSTPVSEADTTPLNMIDHLKKKDDGSEDETAVKLEYKGLSDRIYTSEAKKDDVVDLSQYDENVKFQITLSYSFEFQELENAGYQFQFTLPDTLRSADVEDKTIKNNNNEVIGMIQIDATGTVVTGTFDPDKIATVENATLAGSLAVVAYPKLSKIGSDNELALTIGTGTATFQFPESAYARFADVELTKTEPTAATKDEDGNHILTYTLTVTAEEDGFPGGLVTDVITGDGAYQKNDNSSVSDDGKTLTWNVPALAPNESTTLTYTVQLTGDNVGTKSLSGSSITTTAKLTAAGYERATKDHTIGFKGQATLSEIGTGFSNVTIDGGTLTYTVWVYADKGNNYVLDDVVIQGALDGSINSAQTTPLKLRNCLTYGTFAMYHGGTVNENYSSDWDLTEFDEQPNPVYPENGADNSSFKISVGSLAPGQSVTLVYTVKIEPPIFVAAGNDVLQILTRARILDKAGVQLETYGNGTDKYWNKISHPTRISKSVSGPDNGLYTYTVTVNENGEWDLSGATITDTLSEYMQFVGDVKVTWNGGTETFGATGNAFTLDLSGKPYAQKEFTLTYQAKQEKVAFVGSVTATNTAAIEGTVKYGGKEYAIQDYNPDGIKDTAEVTLTGSTQIDASHQFWYYDRNGSPNGDLYWVIQVKGHLIPAGYQIKETLLSGPRTGCEPQQYPTIVAAYKTDTELDLDRLQSPGGLTSFADYEFNSDDVTISMKNTQSSDADQYIYFVLKTSAQKYPANNWNYHTLGCTLSTKSAGDWIEGTTEYYTIYPGGDLYTQWSYLFMIGGDGSNTPLATGGNYPETTNLKVCPTDPGVYVAWHTVVNLDGSLPEGNHTVTQTIPAGMEFVSLSNYEYGRVYSASDFATIEYSVQNGKLTFTAPVKAANASALKYGTGKIEYQVIYRVTDPDVLLGCQTKEYSHHVELSRAGQKISDDDNRMTLTQSDKLLEALKFQKTADRDDNNSARYTYTITVNPRALDLTEADTVVLTEVLSSNLVLDPSTVKVTSGDDEVGVVSYDPISRILTFKVPDDRPLTITYVATATGESSTTVHVTTNASWKGYESSETNGGEYKNEKVTIPPPNIAGENATLTIQNYSKETLSPLNGAVFELTGDDGTSQSVPIQNGAANLKLNFDTIYCLRETKAPTGYIQNSEPISFVFAKDQTDFGDGVNVYRSGTHTMDIYSHKGSAKVTLQFQDVSGVGVSAISGTYTFGMYADEGGTTLISTQSVTVKSGVDPTVEFTGLDVDKTYYIYELDGNGDPITQAGAYKINRLSMLVSYDPADNAVTATQEAPTPTLTVIHRMNFAPLPSTGGSGTILYTWGGGALTALALLALLYNRKRRGKEDRAASC